MCGAFHKVHLLHDSFARIKTELELAWQQDFYLTHTERKHLWGWNDPSRADTVCLLNQLVPSTRATVVREIAGAFQVQTQKKKWLDVGEECPYCNEPDSRRHRLHACAAFAAVREPFETDLEWFEK